MHMFCTRWIHRGANIWKGQRRKYTGTTNCLVNFEREREKEIAKNLSVCLRWKKFSGTSISGGVEQSGEKKNHSRNL